MREPPEKLIFTDVETTGLYGFDRVVSIATVSVRFVGWQPVYYQTKHFLVNPGKKSSKSALAVHGLSEEVLRKKPSFSSIAGELLPLFSDPSIVWAHNALFDEDFIRREFSLAGHKLPRKKFKCTQQLWERKRGYPSSLNFACRSLGIQRDGFHSALVDAWHAMLVWFELNDVPAGRVSHLPPASEPILADMALV